MITISRFFSLLFTLVALSIVTMNGQSPIPVIVPAASAANAPTTAASTPAAPDSGALKVALKTLQEMKAANEDMLKKQEASLQQLDDIQKAAEQLKIFSKRG